MVVVDKHKVYDNARRTRKRPAGRQETQKHADGDAQLTHAAPRRCPSFGPPPHPPGRGPCECNAGARWPACGCALTPERLQIKPPRAAGTGSAHTRTDNTCPLGRWPRNRAASTGARYSTHDFTHRLLYHPGRVRACRVFTPTRHTLVRALKTRDYAHALSVSL